MNGIAGCMNGNASLDQGAKGEWPLVNCGGVELRIM
jgi:hypothetical protein